MVIPFYFPFALIIKKRRVVWEDASEARFRVTASAQGSCDRRDAGKRHEGETCEEKIMVDVDWPLMRESEVRSEGDLEGSVT